MCSFPATELLARRRAVTIDGTLTTAQMGMEIEAIDIARWRHHERTGCDCWARAIASQPNPFAKRQEIERLAEANRA